MNIHFLRVEDAVTHALWCLRERRHELRERGLLDPVDWLEPSILAEILGLEYELVPTIHLAERYGKDVPVGMLDLGRKHVVVSEELGPDVARFTGAHELGHYLYHQRKYRKHWERAVDSGRLRTQHEREADVFAGMFLMPKKLLRARVEANFGTWPIHINDNVLFHLCGNSIDPDPDKLELEYALAKAQMNFQREHIVPLYKQFKVSLKPMAIELQRRCAFSYPATSYRADL